MNPFHVNVRKFEHGIILDLQGDIAKDAEDMLMSLNQWEQGLDGKTFLVLNFLQVPYINSAGIAILIRLVRYGIKGKYQTFAFGLSAHYQKLFKMVGLTEYMMIYPDEYSVLERLSTL